MRRFARRVIRSFAEEMGVAGIAGASGGGDKIENLYKVEDNGYEKLR